MSASAERLTRDLASRIAVAQLRYDCLSGGDPNAKIAIIGQNPGYEEQRLKVPFVGESGKMLKERLRAMKIDPMDTYMTNAIKRVVDPEEKVNANEYSHWKGILEWELRQLPNLKYVVILGGTALTMLVSDRASVSTWRGTCSLVNGIWYIICNNPAAALRDPTLEVIFAFDIGKLKRVIAGEYQEYTIKYHLDPSPTEAIRWCFKMQDENKPVAYDIETMGGEAICLGLANDPHEGMCINFRDLTRNRWSVSDETRVRTSIARLLASPRARFVAQHASFDMSWLWFKDRIRVRRTWFDTLLAHHTLYPVLPHGLDFLTAQYTDHPYYKDEGKTWKEQPDQDISQEWKYNIKDCCITLKCQQMMLEELRQSKLDSFFFDHVMRLQPHLIRMMVTGVLVDRQRKDELNVTLSAHLEKLKEEFYAAVHHATGDSSYFPEPNSNPQMATLLYSRLGLPIQRSKRKRGDDEETISVGKLARQSVYLAAGESARNVIDKFGKYKEEHKFVTTYVRSVVDEDDHMRCEYKQFGVAKAPGRLSSAATAWGTGSNLQNQPEAAKRMFRAHDGNGFGYFDLSQAEARVVGWLGNITKWKQQFEQARLNPGTYDCHRALASDMYRIKYEDTPEKDWTPEGKPTKRYIAKRCRHGLNYRMMAHRLAQTLECSIDEATAIWNRYHDTTPEIRRWWSTTETTYKRDRVLTTSYGRRMVLLGRLPSAAKDKEAYEKVMESIVAFVPQSTIGDKVSEVIYLSEEDDAWPTDARIVLNVHDALICEAPLPKLKSCLSIMKKHAEKPLIINGEQLIIPAECAMSEPEENGVHYWSGLKKLKEVELV